MLPLPFPQSPEQWGIPALAGVMQALVPALLMNISIVGLNQLYDVEIDKINKPYLPLASGEMTPAQVKSRAYHTLCFLICVVL